MVRFPILSIQSFAFLGIRLKTDYACPANVNKRLIRWSLAERRPNVKNIDLKFFWKKIHQTPHEFLLHNQSKSGSSDFRALPVLARFASMHLTARGIGRRAQIAKGGPSCSQHR
jgi:hypothetical protein